MARWMWLVLMPLVGVALLPTAATEPAPGESAAVPGPGAGPMPLADAMPTAAAGAGPTTVQDPEGDQYLAPAYQAFDIATLGLNASAGDDSQGAGLVWGITFHTDGAGTAWAPPHPDGGHVVVHAQLNGSATHSERTATCLSLPPACIIGTQAHDDFGPDACLFTDIAVELWHEGTLIDHVPDDGFLEYDACDLFDGDAAVCHGCDDTAPEGDGGAGVSGAGPSEPPEEAIPVPLWIVLAAVLVARRRAWM